MVVYFDSVTAFKGGVGKTTLTACLGLGLSLYAGGRVLLVDFDSQANLTGALLTRPHEAYRWAERHGQLPSYEALLGGNDPIVYLP